MPNISHDIVSAPVTISATHDIVVLLGLRNEIVGALVTIFTGALVGLVVAQFYGPFCARYGPFGTHPNLNPDGEPENSSVWCIRHLSTDEIDGRGDPTNLPAGFAIAMPSASESNESSAQQSPYCTWS